MFRPPKSKKMAKHNFIKKVFSPTVVLNLLGIVLFLALLWFGSQKWMDWFTHHGEGIEVPELLGLRMTEAQNKLNELDLQGVVVDSVYDKSKPAGTILDQKPNAGSQVKRGRQIYLTINKSAMDKQPLPSIIGNRTLQQARELLVKNGFIVGNVEYIHGDKNMVLGMKVGGMSVYNGQLVSPDSPVTLVVGDSMTESDEFSQSYDEDMGEWDLEENGGDEPVEEYQL